MSRQVAASTRPYDPVKRVLDVVGAVLGLVVLSPVLVVISALIRIDSRGPALFRQQRVGRGGEPFTMVKFRTMAYGNDESIHREYMRQLVNGEAVSRRNEKGEEVFLLDDPRVTRVGRVLRRLSLDELPNLFNVLTGDMSLVGPRPPIIYEVEMYDERSLRRLSVKPGMTGLAQINGRGALSFERIVAYDLEYVERRSLLFDLALLAKTVPGVLARRGV